MCRLALALTLLVFTTPAALAQDAAGLRSTPEGKARVRVAPRGPALYASVVSLREPNDFATGKPKVDARNPDEGRRALTLVGANLLTGMKPEGDGMWRGSIYNLEDGKTYVATMTLKGGGLEVKGCALSVICKTQQWTR